jgi:hypothetical protein
MAYTSYSCHSGGVPRNRLDFLGITVHYLTSELDFCSEAACFVPLDAQHTGKNQAERSWNCTYAIQNHVFTITTDNASSNDTLMAACRHSPLPFQILHTHRCTLADHRDPHQAELTYGWCAGDTT